MHMVGAHTEPPSATIYQCWQTPSNPATIGTLADHKSSISLTETRASDFGDTVGVVHYKASVDKTTQMTRHADAQNKNTKRLAYGWRQDIGIADEYKSYQTRFIDLLSEFQHMWDCCLGRVNTAKHQIELLEPSTRLIHSAIYRADP